MSRQRTATPGRARISFRAQGHSSAGTLHHVEAWGFIWIMLILKIPLVALLWLVWYAVKAVPEPLGEDDEDGGIRKPKPREPRDSNRPRTRGPHGDPLVPPPPRVRTAAQARDRIDR